MKTIKQIVFTKLNTAEYLDVDKVDFNALAPKTWL